jgi:hypothetical protein
MQWLDIPETVLQNNTIHRTADPDALLCRFPVSPIGAGQKGIAL